MKQRIKHIIASTLVVLGLVGVPVLAAPSVSAQALQKACQDSSSSVCTDDADINSVIGIIVNTLLFLVGAIAVIMIIVGGIKYATSGGDSGSVTSAKNTILYAVIGLAVAIFAYAIVNWVFDLF